MKVHSDVHFGQHKGIQVRGKMISKKQVIGVGLIASTFALILATSVGASGYGVSAPSAPSGIKVSKVSASSVVVTWTAPASNGGSAVTGYAVTSNHSKGCLTTGALSCTLSNLRSGHYRFKVSATNSAGTSSLLSAKVIVLKSGSFVRNGVVSFSKFGSKSSSKRGFLANVAHTAKSSLKNVKLTKLKRAPVLSSKTLKQGQFVTIAFYKPIPKMAIIYLVQGQTTVKLGKARSFDDYHKVTVASFKVPKGLKSGKAKLYITGLGKQHRIYVPVVVTK